MLNREHPVVDWIMRTGYPQHLQPQDVFCEVCGEDITDEDKYEDNYHEFLCERCLLKLHDKGW